MPRQRNSKCKDPEAENSLAWMEWENENQCSVPAAEAEGQEGPAWTAERGALSKADEVIHAEVPGSSGVQGLPLARSVQGMSSIPGQGRRARVN